MIKSFLARVGCLTLVALIALGAWHFRGPLSNALGRVEVGEIASRPSEALAREAEEKLVRLAGDGAAVVTFSQAELQSLLTFRVAPQLPEGIEDPVIELRDSIAVLSARIHPERIEGWAPPEAVGQFLSDSARVAATLVPGLRRVGTGQVSVRSLQAGSLVVPGMMIPFLLQGVAIPGVDASGADLLVQIPGRVTEFELRGSEITIRIEPEGS